MVPIGIALTWIGYAMGFWGRSLLKGYNLSFGEIASPTGYYTGSWPPPLAPNTVLIPTGKVGANASGGPTQTGATTTQINSEAAKAGRPSPGSVAGRL